MTRTLAFSLLILWSLVPVGRADAAVIYDGGGPGLGLYFADANYSYSAAAESFILPVDGHVTGMYWWGGCDSPCATANIQISFYNDAAGTVGSLLTERIVGNANQTLVDAGFWYKYSYGATFAPVDLLAGVQYWVALSNLAPQSSPRNIWGWTTTPDLTGSNRQFTGGNWVTGDHNLAFYLTDDPAVPEPATLALFGFGILATVARRKS